MDDLVLGILLLRRFAKNGKAGVFTIYERDDTFITSFVNEEDVTLAVFSCLQQLGWKIHAKDKTWSIQRRDITIL